MARREGYEEWGWEGEEGVVTHRGQVEKYNGESQRKTIPVVHMVAGAVGGIWQRVGKGGMEMPFEIVTEPVVTVHGMAFSNSSTYSSALRFLVSNVKFLM